MRYVIAVLVMCGCGGSDGKTAMVFGDLGTVPDLLTSVDMTKPLPTLTGTMVPVPAGTFTMGCDLTRFPVTICQPGDGPHVVTMSAFQIDKTEVTIGDYARCVDDGACVAPTGFAPTVPTRVVDNIPWASADAFCKWASKRLPTEAEWERAARGKGRASDDYPWGNSAPDCGVANYEPSCHSGTTQPSTQAAGQSVYEAADMAGNVAEWVADWYAAYDATATTDPKGPATGMYKITRGGSHNGSADKLFSFVRALYLPDTVSTGSGFRCAK